jgi:hypothetical protein
MLEAEAAAARATTRRIASSRTTTTTTAGGLPIYPTSEPFHRPYNVSVVGNNIVVASAPGYRIAIHQMELWNTIAQNIRLLDGSTDLLGPLVGFPAGAGLNLRWQDEPHFLLSYGEPFVINLSAGQVTGFVKFKMRE